MPFESFFGPDDGPLADRVPFRQLDQLARGDRRRRGARRLRRLRRRRVYARNRELTTCSAGSLTDVGWTPVDLPEANRSTIVSVPLGDRDPAAPRGARGRGLSRRARRQPAPVGALLQPRGRHRAGRPRALRGLTVREARGARTRSRVLHASLGRARARSACGPEGLVEPVEDRPVGERPGFSISQCMRRRRVGEFHEVSFGRSTRRRAPGRFDDAMSRLGSGHERRAPDRATRPAWSFHCIDLGQPGREVGAPLVQKPRLTILQSRATVARRRA